MLNLDKERKAYLGGELTHEEYYLKYANAIGREQIENTIKSRRLNENSPLSDWDMMSTPILGLAAAAFQKGAISKKGMTKSEIVCIAKVVYREMA